MKKSFAAFGLTAVLLPAGAFAQSVPVTFEARVTSATNGTDAAAFPVGSALKVAYVINTSAPDFDGDPQRGVFGGATNNLQVSFPTLGVFAEGTSGGAQTFDNYVDGSVSSDQVFLFAGTLAASSNLGGAPITSAEVDYLSGFLPLPDEPTMITGDAVPVVVPAFFEGFVILTTSNGPTFVHFEVTGGGTLLRLTANGSDGPLALAAGNALAVDLQFDAPGNGLANATVAIGVVAPSGTVWFGPAGPTTTPTAAYSGPLGDFGPTPLFNFPSTQGFPPGSYTFFVLVRDAASGATTADVVQVIIS